MNLPNLFRWLAENEWEMPQLLFDPDNRGPFFRAAPPTLARLAVKVVRMNMNLYPYGGTTFDRLDGALKHLGISELHYRTVVEKLEKVKGEKP